MIYEQGHVQIDSHFARFGSKSYAIDKINSVDVRKETKSGCAWIAFAIIAGVVGLSALGSLSSGKGSEIATVWITFVVLAGIAALLYVKRPKPAYHLVLATSSGEVQATNTGDEDAIVKLRQAIEQAMMQRP